MHWMTWRAKLTRPCPEVLQEIPLAPERGGVHARKQPAVDVRHNHAAHEGLANIVENEGHRKPFNPINEGYICVPMTWLCVPMTWP
jgi:hypothetical protein